MYDSPYDYDTKSFLLEVSFNGHSEHWVLRDASPWGQHTEIKCGYGHKELLKEVRRLILEEKKNPIVEEEP